MNSTLFGAIDRVIYSPLDNVGVQYGLTALESGAITPAQFAALNADIGGMNWPVPRSRSAPRRA